MRTLDAREKAGVRTAAVAALLSLLVCASACQHARVQIKDSVLAVPECATYEADKTNNYKQIECARAKDRLRAARASASFFGACIQMSALARLGSEYLLSKSGGIGSSIPRSAPDFSTFCTAWKSQLLVTPRVSG